MTRRCSNRVNQTYWRTSMVWNKTKWHVWIKLLSTGKSSARGISKVGRWNTLARSGAVVAVWSPDDKIGSRGMLKINLSSKSISSTSLRDLECISLPARLSWSHDRGSLSTSLTITSWRTRLTKKSSTRFKRERPLSMVTLRVQARVKSRTSRMSWSLRKLALTRSWKRW